MNANVSDTFETQMRLCAWCQPDISLIHLTHSQSGAALALSECFQLWRHLNQMRAHTRILRSPHTCAELRRNCLFMVSDSDSDMRNSLSTAPTCTAFFVFHCNILHALGQSSDYAIVAPVHIVRQETLQRQNMSHFT